VFRKNANATPSKNTKSQASVLRSSRSDANMQKLITSNLEWIPSLTLASKSVYIGEAVSQSAGLNETTEIEAPSSSIHSLAPIRPLSSREQHERSHWAALDDPPFAAVPYAKLNSRMLQRCKKGYLFNCEKNRNILINNPWLQDIWLWIEGM
jgi:hypothetical protein